MARAASATSGTVLNRESSAEALATSSRMLPYIASRPAASTPVPISAAATIPGLDTERLAQDFDDDATTKAFLADREETRRPNDYVRQLQETHEGKGNAKPDGDGGGWRYVFPTLLFRGPGGGGGEHTVPGWQPWQRYLDAMEAAAPGSTDGGRPDPTVDEARAEWPTITDREIEFICRR